MKTFARLTKLKITGLSTMSTALGFGMASVSITMDMFLCVIGTAMLAAGAAALNQFQERNEDALMERTKNRPLPTGDLSKSQAVLIACILLSSGFLVLFLAFSWLPACLGAITVFWYNGVYTPLKKRTVFAVIPGALVGALPPAIGWTAAGNSLIAPEIVSVMFFFFMWQIPHFWLLLMMYTEDYRKAGFSMLSEKLNEGQMKRVIIVWITAVAATGALLPLFGVLNHEILYGVFMTSGLLTTAMSIKLLKRDSRRPQFRKVFATVNLYAVLLIVCVFIGKGAGL